MPTYTVRNRTTDETREVIRSWSELQEMLNQNPDLSLVPSAPKIVSGVNGKLSKTSDGWKDLLGNMKKHAGKDNSIKT